MRLPKQQKKTFCCCWFFFCLFVLFFRLNLDVTSSRKLSDIVGSRCLLFNLYTGVGSLWFTLARLSVAEGLAQGSLQEVRGTYIIVMGLNL